MFLGGLLCWKVVVNCIYSYSIKILFSNVDAIVHTRTRVPLGLQDLMYCVCVTHEGVHVIFFFQKFKKLFYKFTYLYLNYNSYINNISLLVF